MFKRSVLINYFLTLTVFCSWAQVFTEKDSISINTFPERQGEMVKYFPIGSGDGELGKFTGAISGGGFSSPSSFCFDNDNNLYICDTLNRRFCMFSEDYEYIKSIENSFLIGTGRIEIDSEGNFIGYFGSDGIGKMDGTGVAIFIVYITDETEELLKKHSLYVDNNLVFAYKKDGGLIGFKDPGPDYKENNLHVITDTNEVVRTIQQNHPSLRVERETSVTKQSTSSSGVPQRSSSGNGGYQVFQNGELLSRDFKDFEQNTGLKAALQSRAYSGSNPCYAYMEKYPRAVKTLYSSDDDDNTLWAVGNVFMVFNSSGVPITGFTLDRDRRTTSPRMSPSGDIYYLFSDNTGHYLYKIERDW